MRTPCACAGGGTNRRGIVKPGNDIYLVYSHNWRYDALDPLDPNNRSLETLSRGASVKAQYTYRF